MKNSIRNINRLYGVAYNSIFTINGRLSYDRVTDCLIKLADMLAETETEEFTFQEIGEYSEADLGALIVGAFWHYTEYHKGQDSKEYAALSSLGRIFSPGMEQGPEKGTGEYSVYEMLHQLAGGIIVYFRKFPDGDIIALWNDPDYESVRGMIPSYQHIGQHGEASPELLNHLETATSEEYAPLLNELENRGYLVTVADETE